MDKVPDGEDIFVVSGDKDFRSQLTEGGVNEYLENEWIENKTSSLRFYSKISDFFKDKFPNIKIAIEVERDLLIQKLANSGSFAGGPYLHCEAIGAIRVFAGASRAAHRNP